MKTFARNKTTVEIHQQCKAQGVYIDLVYYRRGGDTICVGAPATTRGRGWVVFNTFNGRFYGSTDKGRRFLIEQHQARA